MTYAIALILIAVIVAAVWMALFSAAKDTEDMHH
jgi:hypothetical protein